MTGKQRGRATIECTLWSLPLPDINISTQMLSMEEQRKHAILFAATLLCGRKLIETIESDKPNLAKRSTGWWRARGDPLSHQQHGYDTEQQEDDCA